MKSIVGLMLMLSFLLAPACLAQTRADQVAAAIVKAKDANTRLLVAAEICRHWLIMNEPETDRAKQLEQNEVYAGMLANYRLAVTDLININNQVYPGRKFPIWDAPGSDAAAPKETAIDDPGRRTQYRQFYFQAKNAAALALGMIAAMQAEIGTPR